MPIPIDPSKVVVADGDPRVREQARRALDGQGFAVVREAVDAATAVAAAFEHQPDVMLIDPDLPGGGIRTTTEITVGGARTAVVMFADRWTDDDLFGALRAGARGYLFKDTDPVRLPLALKGVLVGEAALPRHLTTRLVDFFRATERYGQPAWHDQLTPREWHVLDLLAQGLTTTEIAERLHVAPVTVRSHLSGARRKLGVEDRASVLEAVGSRHRRRGTAAG